MAVVEGMNIEVLGPAETNMYLGRALSLTNTHEAELDHRLKKAWAKFGVFKHELTDRSIPVHLRMQLVHSVVTPTALYGCGSWVMTVERDSRLNAAQMKMVRDILGRKRVITPEREIETWVARVQRATVEARQLMEKLTIPSWTEDRCSRLQNWSNTLEKMNGERWARRVRIWDPDGRRARGRPLSRWIDQPLLSP